MNDISTPISASLVKKFYFKGEEREICPYRIYMVDILKKYSEQTLSMVKGQFFETAAIGGGAYSQRVYDLPRKKLKQSQVDENRIAELKYKTENGTLDGFVPPILGEMTIDQIRIENQVLVFKKECIEKGIAITDKNVQLTIYKKINGILCKGTLDMFPVFLCFGDIKSLMIIDLKLTANLTSTFGEFCWAEPERMDHIQADMYNELVMDIDFNLNSHLRDLISPETEHLLNNGKYQFAYWIFDYKDNSENKWVFSSYDKNSIDGKHKYSELCEAIRKTDNLVNDYYPQQGWPKNPRYERCKNCPILDCDKKETIQII